MEMTDAEILASYAQARNPKKQVIVLADLNGCSAAVMRDKLRELGADVPAVSEKNPEKAKHFDEVRALELYQEGLCDLDIAEQLGVGKYAVANWRRSRQLPVHRAKPVRKAGAKAETPKQPEPSGGMTAARCAEVFALIAKWHPDAAVFMDGKPLGAVLLSSCFDSRSDGDEVEVSLMEG